MRTTILFCMICGLGLYGCGGGDKDDPTVSIPDADALSVDAVVAAASMNVKVGCAKCIYDIEGAKGCSQVAALLAGKPVLITGFEVNAHDEGLCKAAKTAVVQGKLEDNKLVATNVAIDAQ